MLHVNFATHLNVMFKLGTYKFCYVQNFVICNLYIDKFCNHKF
jgi:hypothetical protein